MSETSTLMGTQNADAVAITGGTIGSSSVTEVNALADMPTTVSMTTTPASGTCAVQFIFKNAAGTTCSHAVAGLLYFSSSTGLAIAAVTSGATLTNGSITELKVGNCDLFITTAVGLLGVTVTASTGTYYITIILPNGKLSTSAAIVVN